MEENVERKFSISAVCLEHGHHHTEQDAVLFLAKDAGLPATLRFYRDECARRGAAPRQLLGIDLLVERVERWQAEHPDRVKVADVDDGEAGDRIIAPNVSKGSGSSA